MKLEKENIQSKVLKSYISDLSDKIGFSASRANKQDYRSFLADKYMLATACKVGVPKELFYEIAMFSPFDDEQWSACLDINVRTLQRYKKLDFHVFKPIQSERIFELAEVFDAGNNVFDTTEDFNQWLHLASSALGNKKPIELLDSSYGKDLVLLELSRIEHGIFV
jgi:putative toxin-antitoxin system antitoxin component (TIGR02293 family)